MLLAKALPDFVSAPIIRTERVSVGSIIIPLCVDITFLYA